ncbi:MAG: hypothetical protein ABIQ53_14525 [Terracoccus sp.]
MSQVLNTALGVLGAITAAAGLTWGGVATLRGARATAEKSTADIQRGLIDDLRVQQDRDRLDAKASITTLKESILEQGEQIADLRGQLTAVIADRDGVVAYVKTLWRWIIGGSKPPPPPIPDHLQDILPLSEYVWPTPPQTFDDTTD